VTGVQYYNNKGFSPNINSQVIFNDQFVNRVSISLKMSEHERMDGMIFSNVRNSDTSDTWRRNNILCHIATLSQHSKLT